jgi:hypothetical protein
VILSLAREWFAGLAPLAEMRREYLAELRAAWSREDGCEYLLESPPEFHTTFRVRLPARPEIPLTFSEFSAAPLDLTCRDAIVQCREWRALDGRPLFWAGRCRENRTLYHWDSFVPGEYDIPPGGRLHDLDFIPDETWLVAAWQRIGQHVVPAMCEGLAHVGGLR